MPRSRSAVIDANTAEKGGLAVGDATQVLTAGPPARRTIVGLVDELFAQESRIAKTENLSSITVKLPAENTVCPGVYYYIFKELEWDNITIAEVISTTNEFTVVIGDADIHRAFTILMEAKRQATL